MNASWGVGVACLQLSRLIAFGGLDHVLARWNDNLSLALPRDPKPVAIAD